MRNSSEEKVGEIQLQEPEAVLQPSLAAGKVQYTSFYNVLL